MTTTSKSTHRTIATLKLPVKVPALITYAQGILTKMTGNPAFPSPTPTLAVVTKAINDLLAAEAAGTAED